MRYLAISLLMLGVGFLVAAARVDTTRRLCTLAQPLDPAEAARQEAACRRHIAEGADNGRRRKTLERTGYVLLAAFAPLGCVVVVTRARTDRRGDPDDGEVR